MHRTKHTGSFALECAGMRTMVVSHESQTRLVEAGRHLRSIAVGSEQLLLAPTRSAADELVWQIAAGGAGLFGVHRMTLMQLASVTAAGALAESGRTWLTALGMEALAARVIHKAGANGALHYFHPVAETVGFARALSRTVLELRLERVSPEDLSGLGPAERDLAELLHGYQESLETERLADSASVFDLCADAFRERKTRWAGCPTTFLDIAAPSAVESELCRVISSATDTLFVTLPAGNLEEIARMQQITGLTARVLEGVPRHSLDRLRRYVFSRESPPVAPCDETVVFSSAADEGRECVEIARQIRDAARAGTPFDRMGVLLRSPDTYQPLMEDALRRAGIPAFFSHGSVRPNPAGRAFLALLWCASENLPATRFAEYLSLGQTPDTPPAPPVAPSAKPADRWAPAQGDLFASIRPADPHTEPTSDPVPNIESDPVIAGTLRVPHQWERLLVDAAVIGGLERWRRRLLGLRRELTRQIQEMERIGDAHAEHVKRRFGQLLHLERFALPVIEKLAALPTEGNWSEWITVLTDLATSTLRQPDFVISVLQELLPMGAVGPVRIHDVRDVLEERLTFLRTEPRDRHHGKVFVGTLSEAQARSFAAVFVPGLAEGVFPKRTFEDPLFLDEKRKLLQGRLPTQHDRNLRERKLLRTAVDAAAERIFLSYPRMNISEARPRVPSFYALDIIRAAEGRIPDIRELERRAAKASRSSVGWPSPVEPRQSIDAAEWDLSIVVPLLHAPAENAQGRGCYMLSASPILARSLRTRWRRWSDRWHEVDGIVSPDPGVRAILQRHRPRQRTFSATSLQAFAVCPYRFLLQSVLGLKPREHVESLEHLDPMTRGALFHDIQFEVLTELKRSDLLPVRLVSLEQALSTVDAVLERVGARYQEELAPAIDRVWENDLDDIRADLRGWLRRVATDNSQPSVTHWQPQHFEFAFGLPRRDGQDPASCREDAVILDGVHLRGSMDLIERDALTGYLRITDHKTGKPVQRAVVQVGGGEILQPMLYALAAEALFQVPVFASQLFYCTQRGDYKRIDVSVNEESRQSIDRAISLIESHLDHAFLPTAPKHDACNICDYQQVCGPYEQVRMKRKPDGRLRELKELRELP